MNHATDLAGEALAGRLGIFARTFRRETPQEVAAAVAQAGYPLAHWNFAAIGRPTMGGDVGQAQVAAVRGAFDGAGVAIPSVSATFNLIHPDTALRAAQTAQAVRLIGLVPELGAEVVTLCSGTRDGTYPGYPDRFDRIYVRDHDSVSLVPEQSEVIRKGFSDHHAVVATLRLEQTSLP